MEWKCGIILFFVVKCGKSYVRCCLVKMIIFLCVLIGYGMLCKRFIDFEKVED